MPRIAPTILAVSLLASCSSAPMADKTMQAPAPGSAVLLLYVRADTFPFFTSNTTVTTQGNLNIVGYDPQDGVRTDAPIGRFDISSPLDAGFRSVAVRPGTYAIQGIALYPLWFMCLNKGSLAFEAKPGVVTYLGHLDTMAYVTRLRDFALAHPPRYDHPHLSQQIRQIDSHSFAPAPADLAEAQAFADARLGHAAQVQSAAFTSAAWRTQDNWAGVDECAIKPAKK